MDQHDPGQAVPACPGGACGYRNVYKYEFKGVRNRSTWAVHMACWDKVYRHYDHRTLTYTEDLLYCFLRKRHLPSLRLPASALNRSSHHPGNLHNYRLSGGECFCLGNLLGGGARTNSAYAKNNRVDLLYRLVFCAMA